MLTATFKPMGTSCEDFTDPSLNADVHDLITSKNGLTDEIDLSKPIEPYVAEKVIEYWLGNTVDMISKSSVMDSFFCFDLTCLCRLDASFIHYFLMLLHIKLKGNINADGVISVKVDWLDSEGKAKSILQSPEVN